ncbi:MAG: RluA family pseudouridine synthase [Rickettsiales bacterium]|nr:RluA family pseudouridine synthase [Rickettsiales bacterium]
MNKQIKIQATDKNISRLDKFLTIELKDLSRTKIQALIKKGYVSVNDEFVKDPSFKIEQNDLISLELVPEEPCEITAKKLDLEIIYEDEDLAVINKPFGLTVHPGAGNHNDTLVNALLAHYKDNLSSINGQTRPGIIHRLDRNTSGLLIIAKNNHTHLKLSQLLQERKIKRIYNAIIWGTPQHLEGTIEINIGRSQRDRKKMSTQVIGGKSAITHYKVLTIFQRRAVALLECQLETGRTHQIRVHLSHIGHPIIGDIEYGTIRTKRVQMLSEDAATHICTISRQMLHAKRIIFTHPNTDKLIDLDIDLPEDMQRLIHILKE